MLIRTEARARFIFFGIALMLAAFAVSTRASVAHPSVDVVASNWKFTPATLEAHVGEETTLLLSSTEGVHGIASDELGIKKTIILPDKIVKVNFTPTKAGKFLLHCAIICGAGHDNMLLTVNVVAAAAAAAPVAVVASNWKFTPAAISAQVGRLTTLRLTSSEGVHGLASGELGIKKTIILPGKTVETSFTPAKAGSFKTHCAIVCGAGHDDMILTVNVVEATAAAMPLTIVASNWKFTPAAISTHVGLPTTLHLTSSEGVHGLASDDLGLKQTLILPGKTVVTSFTPAKAGSFKTHCAIVCGAGHENMLLTVNVLP